MKSMIGWCAFALLLAGCASRVPPEPIYIGHLAPRSGADKEVGKQAEQGIVLAIEEARDNDDLIAGRPVAVVHADSRGDGKVLEREAVRLATVNKVAALLGGAD